MRRIGFLSVSIFFLAISFITGCGGSGGGGGSDGRQCVISLYGSETSRDITADVNFDSSAEVAPVDLYIDGNKMSYRNSSGKWVGYSYTLSADPVPGQKIHVKVSNADWGEVEYDMQVCGYADDSYIDSIAFTPGIDTVLKNIDQGKNDYISLEAVLPSTGITGCNNVSAWIKSLNYGAGEAARNGDILTFNMGTDNSRWITVRDEIIEKRRGGSLVLTFRWYGEYKIGTKADIYSHFTGRQAFLDFSLPKKVEGTYYMTADYTAVNGSNSVNVYDYSDTWTITRDFETISITEIPAAGGTVDCFDLSIAGTDIILGDAAGGSQTFTSFAFHDDGSIHGSISGNIMKIFIGSSPMNGNITSGSFELIPAGKR